MNYQDRIREILATEKAEESYDPRHVEAVMRNSYGSLDGLSPERFTDAVWDATMEIADMGTELAEMLAESFGL